MTDTYNLERFVAAQNGMYAVALGEIRAGRKREHWMWYVFPQIAGLGRSDMANYYAMRGLGEAKAYLVHPVLGTRLREISRALLALPTCDARAVFDHPDDRKLFSSMTLFSLAAPEEDVFRAVLNKYFGGRTDGNTLRILGRNTREEQE